MASHPSPLGLRSPPPSTSLVIAIRPHVETLRCPPAAPKTSSERGRAYRARRKQREAEVQRRITELAREIDALTRRRALHEAALVQRRHVPGGSLCRLVEMYYTLFSRGFREPPVNADDNMTMMVTAVSQKAQRQRELVLQSHDEAVWLGTPQQSGREELLTQWGLYTAAHGKFAGEILSIEVEGSTDEPVVVVQSRVVTSIVSATFHVLFPHVRDDWALQDRLLGRDVVYESKTRFRFSAAGQICSEEMQLDLISGLQRAGISLADIALLMQTPTLSSAHTISPLHTEPDVQR
jgi:hypothetical protein